MDATLRFDLPEDDHEHLMALNGSKYWNFLWDLDQECRGYLKYGHKFKTADDVFEWVRTRIPELEEEI